MFRKLFGPFPDEPLLYTFDKILGLIHSKFDYKLNCKDAENQIDVVVPVDVEKIVDDVTADTTTENDVAIVNKVSSEILKTNSQTSKKSTVECMPTLESDKVNKMQALAQQSEHNSSPRSIPKTSSSMECNYSISKPSVGKRVGHNRPISCNKKANSCTKFSSKRYSQTKGFGDSVAVIENTFERKLFRSDGKHSYESILKKETKQQRVIASPRAKNNRVEWLNNHHVKGQTGRKNNTNKTVKLTDRKVIKTEWAVTRIYTFDDDSQTYEIMKKDKVLDKNGGIERIFAITPNLTTVAYEPLKENGKKR